MSLKLGALLTLGFFLALLALSLGDFNRHVDALRARLDASDTELREARLDLGRLRDENLAAAEALDREIADRTAEASDLKRSLAPDADALRRDVLYPSVQVNGKGGVGGGTLLFSGKGRTYAVTAFHVIQKVVTRKGDAEAREPVEVKIYDGRGAPRETVESDLAAYDEKKDLALLRLKTEKVYDNVARLAAREGLRAVKVFTPVYAVGCPLGHDPLPTMGEVATLNKEVGGERFWMMNAPTIYGNSGGGIFHRETRELIGVSVMICTYDGVVSTPVPHLGILVSLDTLYDWLDSLHYQFVYDPSASIEDCEKARLGAAPPPPAPSPAPSRPAAAKVEW